MDHKLSSAPVVFSKIVQNILRTSTVYYVVDSYQIMARVAEQALINKNNKTS